MAEKRSLINGYGKWIIWLAVIIFAAGGSVVAIRANSEASTTNRVDIGKLDVRMTRTEAHYEHIRDDLAEIKDILKSRQ